VFGIRLSSLPFPSSSENHIDHRNNTMFMNPEAPSTCKQTIDPPCQQKNLLKLWKRVFSSFTKKHKQLNLVANVKWSSFLTLSTSFFCQKKIILSGPIVKIYSLFFLFWVSKKRLNMVRIRIIYLFGMFHPFFGVFKNFVKRSGIFSK